MTKIEIYKSHSVCVIHSDSQQHIIIFCLSTDLTVQYRISSENQSSKDPEAEVERRRRKVGLRGRKMVLLTASSP